VEKLGEELSELAALMACERAGREAAEGMLAEQVGVW
jgi:hypothetical protein